MFPSFALQVVVFGLCWFVGVVALGWLVCNALHKFLSVGRSSVGCVTGQEVGEGRELVVEVLT